LLLQLTDDSSGETMMGETTVDETVTGVGNNRGSVDSVGNNRGGVDSVGNNGGMVSGGGVGDNGGSSIVGLSLVGHISNIAIIVVGMVLDVLDPAVRKVDRVLAINNTGAIIVLSLLEGSSGVVISNSVCVGVGRDLRQVISNISSVMGHRGVVSRGGVNHRGVIGGGSMDSVSNDRGGMHGVSNSVVGEANSVMGKRGVDGVGNSVVGERGVDGVNSVGNNSISSVKSVGGISHDSGVGSEGLALGGGPVLSLVGLAHGLVAHLAVSVSIDWLVGAIVDGGDGSGHGGGQHRGVHSGVVTNHSMVSNSVVSEELGGSRGHGGKGETHKSLHVYLFVLRV